VVSLSRTSQGIGRPSREVFPVLSERFLRYPILTAGSRMESFRRSNRLAHRPEAARTLQNGSARRRFTIICARMNDESRA